MNEVILKRFENPDDVTHFEKGKFETVTLGGMTIGRATYQPGWKWSEDVGPGIGEKFCTVEHVGMVVSGCATAAFQMTGLRKCGPGTCFTYPQSHMIVGLLETSLTYRFISWVPSSTKV